jgi:hypothetical protein
MNVKTLLDELCKFVAEMIAQRTPNEILDYFNIKKDATWEEEQELIATHKVRASSRARVRPRVRASSRPRVRASSRPRVLACVRACVRAPCGFVCSLRTHPALAELMELPLPPPPSGVAVDRPGGTDCERSREEIGRKGQGAGLSSADWSTVRRMRCAVLCGARDQQEAPALRCASPHNGLVNTCVIPRLQIQRRKSVCFCSMHVHEPQKILLRMTAKTTDVYNCLKIAPHHKVGIDSMTWRESSSHRRMLRLHRSPHARGPLYSINAASLRRCLW